jgi:hypothetical protein
MSHEKKKKVIHVDKLIVHAKEVKVIQERKKDDFHGRDPWGFFWGRPRTGGENEEAFFQEEAEYDQEN